MLKSRSSAPFALPTRLNSFLPLVSGSGVLMIVAALGAVAGMFCFFHGFSLLQEQRVTPARTVAKVSTHSCSVKTTAIKPKSANLSKRDSHEVIQLSPTGNRPSESAAMTQQGKIAAALLKAGIPNPVTWSAPVEVTAVIEEKAQAAGADVSRVLQQGTVADTFHIPALEQNFPHSPGWKYSLMIWGGPTLTLGCIYILAAHFGWL
jgi:hypothetical protein